MKKLISVLLVIAMLVPMLCVDVFAQETTVNSFDGLKTAIANAADGDVITVNGDITLTETLVIKNKNNITITGSGKISAASALKTVADRQNTLFYINGSTVTFTGLTLDGAKINRVIYSDGSTITLTDAKVINGCPGSDSNINPGGGIFLRGGSLTATNTDFIGNTPGTNDTLSQGDGDKNGGAIYSANEKADITITNGSFVDNDVKAYGHGAAIYKGGSENLENAGTVTVTGTSFKNNKGNLGGGNEGTQGACIHTRENVNVNISNVDVTVAKGFNTGGFLRSLGSNVTVTGSKFAIAGQGDGYGYSGGALCFENGKSKVKGSTFTCTGSKLFHAGGFIDIVGGGEHIIDGNTMTGAGNDNNSAIASFGGAISVEQGAKATVTIKGNTITKSTASDNGGAIAIGTYLETKIPKEKPGEPPIPKETPSKVTMSGNKISDSGLIMWKGGAGGALFVGKGSTVTASGDQIKDTKAPYGGGLYNEGNVTISDGASLTGGIALSLGGEIYNNGDLTVDNATIEGNFVGGASWNGNPHPDKPDEYGGVNIYAEKSVTITPKANITTGKDVRVLDGQSKILLTGALIKEIDVSVSEIAGGNEKAKRKVGYVVAEGTNGYAATKSDANFLHYIGKNKKNEDQSLDMSHYTNQPRAAYDDHTSPGMWDFVLNPEDKTIVLGQRVKLIYHGNTGKIGTEEKKEKTVDVYKVGDFWEKQLDKYKVADPEKAKNEFMGWYFWKSGDSAGDTDTSVQNIKKPDGFTKDLFDFSRVKFENNVKDTDQIITPNVINTYAGWSKNIDLEVEKKWQKSDGTDLKDENEKKDITVTLYEGKTKVGEAKTFVKADNYGGKFENLPVFTKSYEGEEKNMNLRFSLNVYKVEEAALDGFTTSYEPATIIANADGAKKITITNKKEEQKKYKVTYIFITAYTGRQLPKKVTDQLPKEETGKENGATVTPSTSTFNSVVDGDGTWKFKGWIKEAGKEDAINLDLDSGVAKSSDESLKRTIDGADVKYVGVWVYETNPVIPDMVHRVIYEFKSGTKGKKLPTDKNFTDLLPKDSHQYNDGQTVTAKDPAQASYKDTDGTWTFTGWDKTTDTIKGDDVTFIGTWTFEEKEPKTKYKVTYKFKAKNTDKTLPDAINELLPNEETNKLDETEVKPSEPKGKTYEDNENNGTWTFIGWDKKTDTIKGADVTFTGYWTFADKPQPEPKSDFTITKSVDKAYYENVGDVLTYTVIVKNTGEKKLENLSISDTKVNLNEDPFTLDVNASKTFTYTYTITDNDVRDREVINVASVTDGKTTIKDDAKSILKTRRGDVYVRYETEDGKILDEFAVELGAPIDTYYYTEEKAFPGYRYIGLAPYSDPPEGRVIEGTLYVVYLYRERPDRTPDRRRDRYEREEKEEVEPITEAKRKPELNKKDHKQYMYGYPDWTFVPEANITRGEAAAMFARLFKEYPGLDYDFKKYYTDVERTYWGFKEISYLSEFGILSGYSDGTFRPNNKITRAEFVKIAESFEALMWGLSPYKDVDGGHWAFRYIVSSAAKGWINGYLDGTFRPDSYITRAEAVTIVNRLLERHPDKDYIDTHKPELKPFTDLKPSYWAYYEIYEAVEGHFYNRSLTDEDEHWWRLTDERFVFSQPRYNY